MSKDNYGLEFVMDGKNYEVVGNTSFEDDIYYEVALCSDEWEMENAPVYLIQHKGNISKPISVEVVND